MPLPWHTLEGEAARDLPFAVVDIFEEYMAIHATAGSRAEMVQRFEAVLEPHREVLGTTDGSVLRGSARRCVTEIEADYEAIWAAHTTAQAEISSGWHRTHAALPDVEFDGVTYVVPGCMQAQGLADLEHDAIIISLSSVARSHRGSIAGTFQHELLHHHHAHMAPEVFEGTPALYQVVWREGLAVYAAHAVDPAVPRWWHDASPLATLPAARRIQHDLHADRPSRLYEAYRLDPQLGTAPAYAVGAMIAEQLALQHPIEELFLLREDELLDAMGRTLSGVTSDLGMQTFPLGRKP